MVGRVDIVFKVSLLCIVSIKLLINRVLLLGALLILLLDSVISVVDVAIILVLLSLFVGVAEIGRSR